jgi:hypothetical protein
MAEQFPDSASLTRAIKEAIPRDWFAYLDVETSEGWAVIRRGARRRPVPFASPGPQISPAVIQALVQAKIDVVLRFIMEVVAATRLTTSVGPDVDGWAYQLYSDLLLRHPGEADTDYKARIRCLIRHPINGTPDDDLHFLPSPTEVGVGAYLECFGYQMSVSDTLSTGVLAHGLAYGSDVVTPPGSPITGHLPNGYRSEGSPAVQPPAGTAEDMVYSGAAVVATVTNAVTLEQQEIVRNLFRRTRVFGIKAQLIFPTA